MLEGNPAYSDIECHRHKDVVTVISAVKHAGDPR
jgi:hypothetical protein